MKMIKKKKLFQNSQFLKENKIIKQFNDSDKLLMEINILHNHVIKEINKNK